jgi:hypothetical protein
MKQLDICEKCSSVMECMAIIIDHTEIEVKCIHFGCLKRCMNELPNENSMLTPFSIDELEEYKFTFTINEEDTK